MKKYAIILVSVFLLFSCTSKDTEDIEKTNTWTEQKWIIEETWDIIKWYWDTLTWAIHDAKDIKDTIEWRYNELQNIPR